MSTSISILFYPKRTTSNKDIMAVIYVRITIDYKRSDFSTGRKIEFLNWSKESSKIKGHSDEAKAVNRFIDTMRSKLFGIYDQLLRDHKSISASAIKDVYLGKGEKQRMLLEVFQEHNDQIKNLIGKEYAKGTLQRYDAAKNHVEKFLAFQYRKKDIPIQEVDYQFITGLLYYLKSEKNCAHNTAQKYIVNFKKIIGIAFANQWIEKDPFFHWKGSWKKSERRYLTEEELDRLLDKEFDIPRLDQIKDIFVFCCLTGLAYVDIKKLTKDDIIMGTNGKRWIETERQKTKSLSSIPLLLDSEKIIAKYAFHPYVVAGKGVLPVLTNQKYNAYLKEVADLCGIKKNLTTHVARHTFATTVTLANGISMESVSEMLGHKSIKTTQLYAKVMDKKLEREMEELEALRAKLAAKKLAAKKLAAEKLAEKKKEEKLLKGKGESGS